MAESFLTRIRRMLAAGQFGDPRAPGGTGTFTGEPVQGLPPVIAPPFDSGSASGSTGFMEPGGFEVLPNIPFFQSRPRVGSGLDNALLAAAFTPPSETVGGGISAVAQGLMGSQAFREQQALRRQMHPYQMMEAQLGLAGKLGDIEYKQRLGQESEARTAATLDSLGRPDEALVPGMPGYVFDRRSGAFRAGTVGVEGPSGLRGIPELAGLGVDPPSTVRGQLSLPEIVAAQQESERRSPTGMIRTEFERMISGAALPEINAARQQVGLHPMSPQEYESKLMSVYGVRAGTQAGAGAAARHPFQELQDFINQQEKEAYSDLPASPTDPQEFDPVDRMVFDALPPGQRSSYEQRVGQARKSRVERERLFNRWRKSNAPAQGIGFKEWLENVRQAPRLTSPAVNPDDLDAALDSVFGPPPKRR